MEDDREGAWEAEVFEIPGLGVVSATGARARGLLRPAAGGCRLLGVPTEFCAYWSVDALNRIALGPVVAKGSDGTWVPDGELDCLRELVGSALSEWWDTDEARAMVAGNDLRSRLAANDGDAMMAAATRQAALHARLLSGSIAPHDLEAAIRAAC